MDCYMAEYGLVSDAARVQTRRIQKAIDECAATGGGTVRFQPGVYRSGTIVMRSNVYLELPAGAVLKASDDFADYNAPDAWPQNYASVAEHTTGGHFIVFHEVENAGLIGHGVVDGNGMAFGYRKDYYVDTVPPLDVKRPAQMVWICESGNIRVRDVELRNSPYWNCLVIGSHDVIISGLKIKNNQEVPNGDGIDIDCSRNVVVSDCIIDSEDDCITFRCDRARMKNQGAILENVVVTNCQLRTQGCNAFRIGVGNGVIRDCCVSNCVIRGSSKGVCMEARYTFNTDDRRGTAIENIQFSNIMMEAQCPVFISSCCLGPFPLPAPAIRNIRFSGMVIEGNEQLVVQANNLSVVEGITFSGVTLEYTGSPRVQKTYGYSEWDHATNVAAFYLANAADVTLRDVTVHVKEASSPIEAVAIQDNCEAYMDHVRGVRLGEAMPVAIENPSGEYMKTRMREWRAILEDAFGQYGADDATRREMREFLERLGGMPSQLMLLEKLFKYPGSMDEVYIGVAFDEADACRFRLLVILLWTPTIPSEYRKAGFPENLWKDNMDDWKMWYPKMREDLGFAGLTRRIGGWMRSCQRGHVIRMGRLQCEPRHKFAMPFAMFHKDGVWISEPVDKNAPRREGAALQCGDEVVNIHIPASGPLKRAECLDSLRRMAALKRSLGEEFRGFVCYSWLLGGELLKLLPERSNIRDFAALGHALPDTGDQTGEIIWRLWNKAAVDNGMADVPLDTSLRRAAYDFIKAGGKFQEGAFFIPVEELDMMKA